MPKAHHNLGLKLAMSKTLLLKVLTILAILLPLGGLGEPAYSDGLILQNTITDKAIQPSSCEHPPVPPPQIPYPANLTSTPINAPAFPPPGSGSAPIGPGGPVQPPSCEQPPVPPPQVAYPPALTQTPVNSASFPSQPVVPYQPTNYGTIPFNSNQASAVAGAGNAPGIGIPGNSLYGSSGTTTLLNPLVPGANFSMPGIPAMPGALPAIGSGFVPIPVNPGMLGQPFTPVPWTDGTAGNPYSHPASSAVIPANQIDQQSNVVGMPYSNQTVGPPGSWKANVPHVPSTPGSDPGILRQPGFNAGTWASGYSPTAKVVPLPDSGQFPTNVAPTTRSKQRGSTNDFGLGQMTLKNPKVNFAYRMQMSKGQNGEPIFNGWKGLPGSTTQDSGLGVKQLQAKGQLGSIEPPQISYDSARPATYPGGQSNTGSLNSNSLGNHGHNANPPLFADAQVTNDLYGTPMINPARNYTDPNGNSISGIPLTTIAPY